MVYCLGASSRACRARFVRFGVAAPFAGDIVTTVVILAAIADWETPVCAISPCADAVENYSCLPFSRELAYEALDVVRVFRNQIADGFGEGIGICRVEAQVILPIHFRRSCADPLM